MSSAGGCRARRRDVPSDMSFVFSGSELSTFCAICAGSALRSAMEESTMTICATSASASYASKNFPKNTISLSRGPSWPT